MGLRGPKPGHGGRPRKSAATVAVRSDGYKRVSVGAKSKGTQVYAHRAAAGLGRTKGSKSGKTGGVVDHKNRRRADNRKANLRVTTKRTNAKNRD